MEIGNIINRFRTERKMTLLELSRKSGVAMATLSRIENGKMTGTLKSHINIANALEISLPELYKNLDASKRQVEIKTGAAETDVIVNDRHISSEILTSGVSSKKMMPVMIRLGKASATRKEETRLGIEKFTYIIDGKLEAAIGDKKYNLAKGDTLYFESALPHYFRNAGKREARLLVVTCPPII